MKNLPEIELQSSAKIKSLQEVKMRELLDYVSRHSPFYKKLFAANRIAIHSIQHLEDIAVIPPTIKDDFHQNNWDFLCVDRSGIVEYTSTSGTMGKPVTVALTDKDL